MFSVAALQEQIEQQYNVALDRQVLLASGGECLDAKAKVCSYSAGTDTNPIFLFSKYYRGEECPRIRDILTLIENKGEKRFLLSFFLFKMFFIFPSIVFFFWQYRSQSLCFFACCFICFSFFLLPSSRCIT